MLWSNAPDKVFQTDLVLVTPCACAKAAPPIGHNGTPTFFFSGQNVTAELAHIDAVLERLTPGQKQACTGENRMWINYVRAHKGHVACMKCAATYGDISRTWPGSCLTQAIAPCPTPCEYTLRSASTATTVAV